MTNYEKLAEYLTARGYEDYTYQDDVYWVKEEENVTYTVELSIDGSVIEYRHGNGIGCFDVVDGEYASVDDYIEGIESCTK